MEANPYPINSREWWEEYFIADWDAHGGGDQTRHFMERLLAELLTPEKVFLGSGVRILDWGCAFGEGVELLAQAFPRSHVAGLDFASRAIAQARKRHPNREFILAEKGVPREFDVIITSNCLEHYEHPLEMVSAHQRSCRRLWIGLVPYNESPLHEQHRYQFREESFPKLIGHFVRLYEKVININPLHWPGQQLLVVYGSQLYINERVSQLEALLSEREESLEALAIELASKCRQIEGLTSDLTERVQTVDQLESQMAEKDRELQSLSKRIGEKEDETRALAAEVADKHFALEAFSSEFEKEGQRARTFLTLLRARETELEKITSTLGWRWLKRYGRIKYRYLLPIYRWLSLPPYDRKRDDPGEAEARGLQIEARPGQQIYKPKEARAHDIVCFPIIDWDFRFQRPQQLMLRFAAAGHRVFYISQTFHSSGPAYRLREERKNIYEVSLRGNERDVYTESLDAEARDALLASLDALRRDLYLGATAACVQLPFWWPLAEKVRDHFGWPVIYDCMDHHAGFSTNKQIMLDNERDLLAAANLVVVSSAFLENQARQHNSNVLLVRNACDFDHFAGAGQPKNERPTIGYYGAIADWFDSDLVADMAERRPDWDFLLVGSTFSADLSRLSKLPNLILQGEKPYSEVPDWLSKFDVAIIPFKRTELTEATNPVKAYEILAAGRPLVSVPIPEVAALAPLVRLASTAEEFISEIVAALREESPEVAEERRAFARNNTWEKRHEVLAAGVRDAFPKASIIILTFNNLDLNRLCLESLYLRTEWPNFEVIVLDNASSDGTPEYLKKAEEEFPNLRVILNDTNLGFARANNMGLKQASGEFLVLLNNDTVLTRGWLSSLIRHLYRDPDIGLIGPVTNEIGNEAKVPVGYAQLEDMPQWAASYVRQNDNRLFNIPMLAMFCVALRREVLKRVGLLDEDFEIGMFEDDDYAHRVRQNGYKVVCACDSFVHHFGQASFKMLSSKKYLEIFEKNRRTYENKWGLWQPHMDNQAREWIPDLRDQMRSIVEGSEVDPRRIVLFPPSTGWRNSLMERPHYLALELARQGFLVFFDCSGSWVDDFAGFVQAETNLWLYKGPKGVLDTLENPILWVFSHNASLAGCWRECTIVYDWIGHLSVFPHNQKLIHDNHTGMLQRADIVLCAAQDLHEQAKGQRPDAVYVPNGVEYVRFSSPPNAVGINLRFKEIVDQGRPVAGYYGAITTWFDVEMLTEVAEIRPDWSFVIVAQSLPNPNFLRSLEEKSNVLILGEHENESVANYLAQFTVATILFKKNQITDAISPSTLYECFAAGKPVISTPILECQSFEEVLIVGDAKEFSQALDVARERSSNLGFLERLRFLGRENSWEKRVQTVAAELSRKLNDV